MKKDKDKTTLAERMQVGIEKDNKGKLIEDLIKENPDKFEIVRGNVKDKE